MTAASQLLFSCHFGPRYRNGDAGPLSLIRERSARLRWLAGGPDETRGVREAGQTFGTGCGPEIRHEQVFRCRRFGSPLVPGPGRDRGRLRSVPRLSRFDIAAGLLLATACPDAVAAIIVATGRGGPSMGRACAVPSSGSREKIKS